MDRQEVTEKLALTDRRAAMASRVHAMLGASVAVKLQVMETQLDTIVDMAAVVFQTLLGGGKVMFCGNGISAADAQHLAAEMLVRLRPHVNREGLPALALAGDTSSLTACANDFGYEVYYARLVRTLGQPGDTLIGISTSGKSPNVVRALRAAHEKGISTLGLLGAGGGPARRECDIALVVPSTATAHVQETHVAVGHALIEIVEGLLLEAGHLVTGKCNE